VIETAKEINQSGQRQEPSISLCIVDRSTRMGVSPRR
jgi:hypothetical protein